MDDLKDLRAQLKDVINRNPEWKAIMAEDFHAQPLPPKDVCLQNVAESDVYVGIFDEKYGYIPKIDNPQLKSVCVLEYECAKAQNIPRLVFISESSGKDPALSKFLKEVSDFENGVWIKKYIGAADLEQKIIGAIYQRLLDAHDTNRKSQQTYYQSKYFLDQESKLKVAGHIKRTLIESEVYYKNESFIDLGLESLANNRRSLEELIGENKKRIVLLADAGYGKSCELKNLFSQLTKSGEGYWKPIYVPLNIYTGGSLEKYIENCVPDWRGIASAVPPNQLIFLLDDYDQVKDKESTAKEIEQFASKYSDGAIIVACRTNFYSNQFKTFQQYNLPYFNKEDVLAYCANLKIDGDMLLKEVSRKGMYEYARNPFFLKYLCDIYSTAKEIPSDRKEIFNKIIDDSIAEDVRVGRICAPVDAGLIKEYLIKMAVVFEILQRNWGTAGEISKVVSEDGYGRIERLSLIKKTFADGNQNFQFIHNNIQEYLAALKLSEADLWKIVDYIGIPKAGTGFIGEAIDYLDTSVFGIDVGKVLALLCKHLRKYYPPPRTINPSWANTTAFLVQLRPDMFGYIYKTQPEFSLKFDADSMGQSNKSKVFWKVFNSYSKRHIVFSQEIDPKELARFCADEVTYKRLKAIAQNSVIQAEKINSFEVLRYCPIAKTDPGIKEMLLTCALNNKESEGVRRSAVYALAGLKCCDAEDLSKLIEIRKTGGVYLVAAVFSLVSRSVYVETQVDAILDELGKQKSTTLMDYGYNIAECLKNMRSASPVRKVLGFYSAAEHRLSEYRTSKILEVLIPNATQAFADDPKVADSMWELFVKASESGERKAVKPIREFFLKTNLSVSRTCELLKNVNNESLSLIADIVGEAGIEVLISEYQAGRIAEADVWKFVHYFRLERYDDIGMLSPVYEVLPKQQVENARDWKKEREQAFARDLEIIFDKEKLVAEITNVFDAAGKKTITEDDLDRRSLVQDPLHNSQHVYHLLLEFIHEKGDSGLNLDDVLGAISKWDYREYSVFQAHKLFENSHDFELKNEYVELIRGYCVDTLPKLEFRVGVRENPLGHFSLLTRERIVAFFMRKYSVECPEAILKDMTLFDWLEGQGWVGLSYVEERLPADTLRRVVLENLKQGITVSPVLHNHISYCAKHDLSEASAYLEMVVFNPDCSVDNRDLALDTLVKFSVQDDVLLKVSDFDIPELFEKAATELLKRNYDRYTSNIEAKMDSKKVEIANKATELLINSQNIKAIMQYVAKIKEEKKFRYNRDDCPLMRIKTSQAIPILLDLLEFSYCDKVEEDEFRRLSSTTITVLREIAILDVSNMRRVCKGLDQIIGKLGKEKDYVHYLHQEISNIEKAYYISVTTPLANIGIEKAIEKANQLYVRG